MTRNTARWFFVLPALIITASLLIYPIFSSIYYSFTTKNLIRPMYAFAGFDNYRAVLASPSFWNAFFNSIIWTVCSLLGQILVGFSAALALNRVQRGRGIYKTLLIIPWAFPSIVIALSWKWILNGVYGILPNLITKLLPGAAAPQFLTDRHLVFISLVCINIWFGAPLIMVNLLAALQSVPRDEYEAAKIDGARAWQSFIYITMQHIKVVMGLLIILRAIWIFNNFDLIYLITGGGPAGLTETLPIYAYHMGWTTKLLGRASVVTVLLFLFMIALSLMLFCLISRWEKEDSQ